MTRRQRARIPGLLLMAASAALLAGCSTPSQSQTTSGSASGNIERPSDENFDDPSQEGVQALPSEHVHGVGISGHPGPGVDIPQPVGLIESTDGGRTWSLLSRQGQSDFHALTASAAGVVGFDGALLASADGRTWQPLDPPSRPYSLAANPDCQVLLAITESGLVRSTDGGLSWQLSSAALLTLLVDWAQDQTVVGITPAGTVQVSTDAGETWSSTGDVGAQPQALGLPSEDT